MTFYTYRQNNSGGDFNFDAEAGISVIVIVEADSTEAADRKAEDIGLYFDGAGDCSCCGDRWYSACDYDAADRPVVYDQPAEEYEPYGGLGSKWIKDGPEGYIHYADGRVVPFCEEAKSGVR